MGSIGPHAIELRASSPRARGLRALGFELWACGLGSASHWPRRNQLYTPVHLLLRLIRSKPLTAALELAASPSYPLTENSSQ